MPSLLAQAVCLHEIPTHVLFTLQFVDTWSKLRRKKFLQLSFLRAFHMCAVSLTHPLAQMPGAQCEDISPDELLGTTWKQSRFFHYSKQVCLTALCSMVSPCSSVRFKGTVVLDPANPSEVHRLSEILHVPSKVRGLAGSGASELVVALVIRAAPYELQEGII